MEHELVRRSRVSRWTRTVGWLVLAAAALSLLVLFIADNFVVVEIRLFTLHRAMRLAWALLLTFLTGLAAGALLMWYLRRHQGRSGG